MLSIFATTEFVDTVRQIIRSEDRLEELVTIYNSMEHTPLSSGHCLIIDKRGILPPIDWFNVGPPYLLSNPLPFDQNTLLSLIFNKLGNTEKAWYYSEENPVLQHDLSTSTRLQYGVQISIREYAKMSDQIDQRNAFDNYRSHHNAAIIHHYGFLDEQVQLSEVTSFYEQALQRAPNEEYKAFTIKHYAGLHLDAGNLSEAETLLSQGIRFSISEDAKYGLNAVLCNVWMKQLTVPYDQRLLEKLKNNLWETLQFFESQNRKAESGLLLLDAAHIANISESFSESLGYITKAIQIFQEEELTELSGNAQLRKGTLLYTWAQNGNPQFYKPAVEAYQEALKVFRQDVAPEVFAEIHHNLAVLYAEMPADNKKRGIWAGVASASFQEALNYYTKDAFPYEYGMICNNFGNALNKFPPAIHSDNYEKALFYYGEALQVRAPNLPVERAITLLNFLETSWNVGNSTDTFNHERYQDMVNKANEVLTLVDQPDMIQEAQKHLDLLHELKQTVNQ